MQETNKEKITIDYSEKAPLKRTYLYQNDFFITMEGLKSKVTILSSQPIYANETKDNFEIMDEEFSNLMGYGKFTISNIITYDIDSDNKKRFISKLESMLGELSP